MNGVNIYLEDGTFNGTVTLRSASSKITAIRVAKDKIHDYPTELDGVGVYLLLIEKNSIYVGQTGLNTLEKRITNTHTGDIDSKWHTALAFKFDSTTNANELLFVENAMCEYVYNHFAHCLTTTPKQENCNVKFRTSHYHLPTFEIKTCENFVADIQHYIELFPETIFPKPNLSVPPQPDPGDMQIFFYQSSKGDVAGQAAIDLNTGKTMLKKGSNISVGVSPHFAKAAAIMKQRQDLSKAGKINGQVLQEDLRFNSPSGAEAFLTGTSVSGNEIWKRVSDKKKLGDVLKG